MKNKIVVLMLFSLTAHAETIYVTDTMRHALRSEENSRSKIVTMLTSGMALTSITKNPKTGYTFVKTKQGREGYILTKHTMKKTPVTSWEFKKTKEELEALQRSYNNLNTQLIKSTNGSDHALYNNQTLTKERDKLKNDLEELRKTASNAIQLKHQRDQLKERIIPVERELEQLKLENQTLKYSENQDWFLYGGLLALLGVFLGFIIPKLSWSRKSNRWDTF